MAKLGRPRKFETVEDIEERINEYWSDCEVNEKPITMAGLALFLGVDRKTLVNYKSMKDAFNKDFFPAIKRAKQIIEMSYEEQLLQGKATAGVIFSAKNNFGWVDKMDIDNTSSDGSMTPTRIEIVSVKPEDRDE